MAVEHVWVGAVTPTTAWVRGKVSGASVRLAVDTDAGLESAVFFGPVSPTADGMASIEATGLDPNTRYWYAFEEDSVLQTAALGQFRTHPPAGQPASFTFAASSCAGQNGDNVTDRVSNGPGFDTIRERGIAEDWLFLLHMGDLHYRDIGSGVHVPDHDLATYRTAFDDTLTFNGTLGLDARQGQLYRNLPIVYQWDDHDFGGNNSNKNAVGKTNAQVAYRERLPHYPLPAGEGAAPVYHSFEVGRVLVIVADHRSDRDPNGDPDGPGKTMLGAAQKAWMAQVLANSNAKMLIWATEQYQSAVDSWRSFDNELVELRNLFASTGWLDRMLILSGDIHALAMDTGAGETNPWGVPTYLFSSIDSDSGDPIVGFFDTGPSSPGRERYGTVEIDDDGTTITVTGRGWIDDVLWRTHSFVVDTTVDPTPTPTPEPAPVAQAKIRNRITWLGCRIGDGRIVAELPDITGQVSRVLGRYTSASLSTPIPLDGPGAVPLATVLQATQPARIMIVAVVNDVPTWAGIPLPRTRGTPAEMPVGCVSPEGYLQHRMVRSHQWTQQDEASVIAAGLLADAGDIAGIGSGIGLTVDAPATGRLRNRTYLASDRKTVYDALTELMAVQDGPEWTIDLDWTNNTMTAVKLIARVRPRIGVAAANPTAIFETTADSVFASQGGADAVYELVEDYSGDLYANYVIAYSSGEGEDQPASDPAIDQAALDAGAPIWEQHFQPDTGITSLDTLNEHAQAQLARVRDGAATLKITARWSAYPRYGVDWKLGDDIGYDLRGHGHPNGFAGQGRAVGFELDAGAGTIRPLLQSEADLGAG